MLRTVLVCAFTMGLVATATGSTRAGDDAVGPVGTIAYIAGGFKVCLVNADGSGRRCLTRSRGYDQGPVVWSADGRRIAFEREHDTPDPSDRSEVLIMRPDGRFTVKLTPPGMQDFEPAWSPVAPKIAFTRWNGSRFGIFTANADGTGVRELRPRTQAPSWSPDGARIAFSADDAGVGTGIYVMKADGTSPRLLLRRASGGDWSPDGRRLLFVDKTPGFKSHVFVMNANGGGVRRVTKRCAEDYHPSWSPDGRRIAFTCLRTNEDIFTLGVDGTTLRRLTFDRGPDYYPAWSPDGKWLAYVHENGVWVMRSDGASRKRIASPTQDFVPTWAP